MSSGSVIELPLTAIKVAHSGFLCDFMSLSHHSGGILARSPFQHCFSSLRFVGIYYSQLS